MNASIWFADEYEKALSSYRDALSDGAMALKRPAVVDVAGLFDGDQRGQGPHDAAGPTLDARCEWFGAPVVQVRTTEIGANRAIVEFRVAPMADPIIHFAHGVWYRIEVVDGAPTIRPLPEEE